MIRRTLTLTLLAAGLLGQGLPEDPVAKARSHRADPGDLPPVPRGVVEPPPLPAPETHPKDLRGARRASKGRVVKGKSTRKASPKKAPAKKKAKAPARAKR